MRARPAGIDVGQEMKLGSEEKNQEQQADEAGVCANGGHVTGKTQLRGESLLGQGPDCLVWLKKATKSGFGPSKVAGRGVS